MSTHALINKSSATVDGCRQAMIRCPDPYDTYVGQLPQIFDRARRDGQACVSPLGRS
jgi:hypothetical protein